jgi:hypothetical protein
VIAKSCPGVKSWKRNEIGFKHDEQPGVALLDGNEDKATGQRIPAPILPPQIMRLQFGLYIQAKDKRPTASDVGTLLNTIRVNLIRLMCEDAELKALIGANGALEYNGLSTDLRLGSELSGQFQLNFTANYFFNPRA